MTTTAIARTTGQKDHRPPRCPDHRGRKEAGCKPCRALDAWYNRQRRRGLRNGTWEPLAPTAPVSEHITRLITDGWTCRQLADRTGIDETAILDIKEGRRTRGVTATTAGAILGVTGPGPGRWLVPAIGTRRRLRALGAIGYTRPDLANRIGTTTQVLDDWVVLDRVTATTRDRVKAVYDQIGHLPGPSNRARACARKFGYAPPMAWEGVNIDDPNAEPLVDAEPADPDAYDPITVGLAVDQRLTYDQIASHQPDLIETIRRLATRMTDAEIAIHLRWPGAEDGNPGKTRGQGAVCHLRYRNGIPSAPRPEAVVAYQRPDRRRTRQVA